MPEQSVQEWLMAGDPVIRWQVMRDLLDEQPRQFEQERRRTLTTGWGSRYIQLVESGETWNRKDWGGTVWVLTLMAECGIPEIPSINAAVDRLVSERVPDSQPLNRQIFERTLDLCHAGFYLRLLSAYRPDDPRIQSLAKAVHDIQMSDGGWNCRLVRAPQTRHGSFHTTFNVLEGLREANERHLIDNKTFAGAERKAIEFTLRHRLYRSETTNQAIEPAMERFPFPWYYHYTAFRGLDYLRNTGAMNDERTADAVALLRSKETPISRWKIEGRIAKATPFDMEKPGESSRWNTLRALRVLQKVNRQ